MIYADTNKQNNNITVLDTFLSQGKVTTLEVAMVTDYRGHHRTLLPV